MTYRDDNDALRARVEKLETDLAESRSTVERLRGEAAPASSLVSNSRWLGVPARFERDELLPFEISDQGYERIAAILRARLNVQVSQVGRSLHAPPAFSLDREGAGTRIRMKGDWSGLAIGVPVGAFLGLLLPGMPAIAFFANAAQHGLRIVALQAIWAIPSIAAGASWLMRKAAARQATRGVAGMTGTFEAVLEAARAHAVGAPATRVDIADHADDEAEGAEAVSAAARRAE